MIEFGVVCSVFVYMFPTLNVIVMGRGTRGSYLMGHGSHLRWVNGYGSITMTHCLLCLTVQVFCLRLIKCFRRLIMCQTLIHTPIYPFIYFRQQGPFYTVSVNTFDKRLRTHLFESAFWAYTFVQSRRQREEQGQNLATPSEILAPSIENLAYKIRAGKNLGFLRNFF